MIDNINIVALEEQEKEKVWVVLNVLTRPQPNSSISLQEYYEDLAYQFAEYERVKITTNIDVELNPVNESALLRFEIKRPKKLKQNSLFSSIKHKRRAQ